MSRQSLVIKNTNMEEQTMSTNLSRTEETKVNEVELAVERLTKREYFAALALQSILKNSTLSTLQAVL
jgi:hypothetical protein